MKKILVVGSVSVDYTVSSFNLPKPGETVIGDSFMTNIGGKGANQAFAAYYLGGDVAFCGALGKDENGERILNFFKSQKIKFKFLNSSKSTGIANIILNKNNSQNQIIIVPGSNHELKPSDVETYLDLIKKFDIIVVQLEILHETVWHLIEVAHNLGKTVILNPAPATYINPQILEMVDYIIPNETELDILTKECPGDPITKARYLHRRGVKNVIVTLGEKGSYLVNNTYQKQIEPYRVKAVDTTAAGDTFVGAFAYALSNDMDILDSLELASKASAYTVTKPGAIQALPHMCDIEKYQR